MHKKYLFVVLILILISPRPIHADMDSFKDVIETEEAKEKDDSSSDQGEGGDSTLGMVLFQLFQVLWLYNNTSLYYADYPYDGRGYVRRPWVLYVDEINNPEKNTKKYYWFSAGLSALYMQDMGAGLWASFSGNIYKFIGPYADVYVLTDGADMLNGLRLGVHFSLLQFRSFNAGFYAQWQLWYGLMLRNAGVFGVEFRFYPVRPLTLRAKLGGQNFESFSLGEAELEMGCMIRAWEIFAGYRWWTAGEGGPESQVSWKGPFLGGRRYF